MNKFLAIQRLRFSSEYWRKSWKEIFKKAFAFLGAVNMVLTFAARILPKDTIPPITISGILLILFGCMVLAFFITTPMTKISYKIEGLDVRITVAIGNVFEGNGDLVLSCNTAFDTSESGLLSNGCLRAQYQKRFYSDNVASLDNAIESALNGVESQSIPPAFNGAKSRKYPVGTIATVCPKKDSRTFFVAFSEMSNKGRKNTTAKNFRVGLNCLWEKLNESTDNKLIKMPVLCSGESNLQKSREEIIKNIVFSYVNFVKEYKLRRSLSICIHPNDLKDSDLDMYSIEKFIELVCAGDLMDISETSDDADSLADEKTGTMKEA